MIWGDILLLFSPFGITKLNSNLSPTKRRHVKSFTAAYFLMGNQIHWDEWKITFVNSRIIALCAVWRWKWWVSEECETGNLLVIEWKGAIFVVIFSVTTKLNWMIDVLKKTCVDRTILEFCNGGVRGVISLLGWDFKKK